MANPYLRRLEYHKIGKAGRASEKRVAKRLNAKPVPASGAMAGLKGDMTLGEVLIEAKSTMTGSIGIKLAWLVKVALEARVKGRTMALAVSFVDPQGRPKLDGDWIMIPLRDWQELRERHGD